MGHGEEQVAVVVTSAPIGANAKETGNEEVGSQHADPNGVHRASDDSAEVAQTSTEIDGADELNGHEQQASSDSDLVAETGNSNLREMMRVDNEGLVADVVNRGDTRADSKAEEKQEAPDQEASEQEVHDRMPRIHDRVPQERDASDSDAGVRLYDGNVQVERPEGPGSVSPFLLTLLTVALLGTVALAFIRSRGAAHSHSPLALEEDIL